jgi:hypothetical protein
MIHAGAGLTWPGQLDARRQHPMALVIDRSEILSQLARQALAGIITVRPALLYTGAQAPRERQAAESTRWDG